VEAFLEHVVKQLIEYPDELAVTRHDEGKRVTYFLTMRQSDIGKVIGKSGHTIEALRTLVSSASSRNGQRASVEIVEPRH